jgi:hypothetical protein
MDPLEHTLAFVAEPRAASREVRVNFGVFAGRATTPAEIDDLARALLPELGEVTIVAEDRHELSASSEVSVHQVRIEVPDGADADRVAELAERWADGCISARHAEVSEQL